MPRPGWPTRWRRSRGPGSAAGEISRLEQEQAAQEAARARQASSTAREAARLAAADLGRALAWEGPAPRAVRRARRGRGPAARPTRGPAHLPHRPERGGRLGRRPQALVQSAGGHGCRFPLITAGADWGDPTQSRHALGVGLAVPLPLWSRGGGPVGEARARAEQAAALVRRPGSTRPVRSKRRGSGWRKPPRAPASPATRCCPAPPRSGSGRCARTRPAKPTSCPRSMRSGASGSVARGGAGPARLPGGAGGVAGADRTGRVSRGCLFAAVLALAGCGGGSGDDASPADSMRPGSRWASRRWSVTRWSRRLALTGRLAARPGGAADLSAPAAGVVRELRVQVGDPVRRGAAAPHARRAGARSRRRGQGRRRGAGRARGGAPAASSWPTGSPRRGRRRRRRRRRGRPRPRRRPPSGSSPAPGVTSPIAGRVQSVGVRPGERVDAGRPLVQVVAPDTLDLVVPVPAAAARAAPRRA